MTSAPTLHPACLDPEELLRDCEVRRTRRGGPGGQHRNKVETAVELLHRPSGVSAQASERRNQHENLQVATRRLRVSLAIHVRSAKSGASADALVRCGAGETWWSISDRNPAFPCVLARLLDALAETDWNVAATAKRTGCSSSQIIKLLAHVPAALRLLNEHRGEMGLRPLRART